MTTDDYEKTPLMTLSIEQQNAIELLLAGYSDREVAERVGKCRETVTKWRLYHPAFKAELNSQRRELWNNSLERLRSLVPKAISALEDALNDPASLNRPRVALEVLKMVEFSEDLPSISGPYTAEGVVRGEAWAKKNNNDFGKLGEEPTKGDMDRVKEELKKKLE